MDNLALTLLRGFKGQRLSFLSLFHLHHQRAEETRDEPVMRSPRRAALRKHIELRVRTVTES